MKNIFSTLLIAAIATLGLSLGSSAVAQDAPKTTTVALNAADGAIEFVGAKVTGDHDGGFKKWTGTAELNTKGELVGLSFEVDTTSIYTDNEKLTGHLKSPDFFDVNKYPKASFQSSKIEKIDADGATHRITGTMNLHGVIKKIAFPATIERDGDEIDARAEFVINRFDWDILYKGMADDLIKKEVLLKIEFEIATK